MKQRLYFNEVMPRDGLQNEAVFVATEEKVALVDHLSICGFAKIEVTSFTSPKAIPMLRDAEQVMHSIRRVPGVEYSALVPNLRGAERALACDTDELNLVISCSESHNRSNLRMTREESISRLTEVIRLAHGRAHVNVSLSCAFGCPMEGAVPQTEVLRLCELFAGRAVRGLTLCDTTGMAHPGQARDMAETVLAHFGSMQLTFHFHDTRGMGLANVLASAESGIRRFDGSLGGLGGCPYAPGASGNICSEDAIHMLEAMGYDTGMDLLRVLDAARAVPQLVGHPVPGQVAKAGRIADLHPAVACPLSLQPPFKQGGADQTFGQ